MRRTDLLDTGISGLHFGDPLTRVRDHDGGLAHNRGLEFWGSVWTVEGDLGRRGRASHHGLAGAVIMWFRLAETNDGATAQVANVCNPH